MGIARDDRWLTDAQGRALAGAQVYYCAPQPANTSSLPPSPLTTVYTSLSGGTTVEQPLLTDGFGHSVAYVDNSQLYTLVFVHPLFGPNPIVLPDQVIGGGGTAGVGYLPVQASTTAGTITGSIPGNTFELPSAPVSGSLMLQQNGQVLTPGLGYSLSGTTITLALPLSSGDNLNANYLVLP